jgi:phosphate starvation-inducible PhoH-like protein
MTSMRKQRQRDRNWRPPPIEALTEKQATYLSALNLFDCVISTGPAGTGKTYLACSWAAQQLFDKQVHQVVLARPTVSVGRTMGFLPGDVRRKMAPWARPLVEAFKQVMSAKKYEDAVNSGQIKIEALEHIRGLTFDSSIMILDEAQNSTPGEMKAFLTRIGDGSCVVLCGDVSQSDLDQRDNGLSWTLQACDRGLVSDVSVIHFTSADTVRSELCRMWGEAFDQLEQEEAPRGRPYR